MDEKDINGEATLGIGGYAELFETIDDQPIDCGYFITLEEEKLELQIPKTVIYWCYNCNTNSISYRQGSCLENKYLTDEWGRILDQEVLIPEMHGEDGSVVIPEHIEKKPKINPKWDKNQTYIPREFRKEWVSVALMGQVLVRDDGSCKENGYCIPADGGIATSAPRGYRVLERRRPNQILILLKATAFPTSSVVTRTRTSNQL